MAIEQGDSRLYLEIWSRIPERDEVRGWLEEMGVCLEADEVILGSLRKVRYTEKHADRRVGLVEILGEDAVENYEEWALAASVGNCPRFEYRKRPVEGSQSRGLRQLLADLVQLAVDDLPGGMEASRFEKRTKWRIRKGMVYAAMKEAEESGGKDSEEYRRALVEYRKIRQKAKNEVGVVAMVPLGATAELFDSLRHGCLPVIDQE